MIALIAEKPSVAKDIARIIGATGRNDGYLSGNGYMVAWAFGHLIQLAMPEAYGVANFRRESLPILPPDFQLIPRQVKAEKGYKADPGVLKQLKVIKEVFDRCDRIIVATDAGREGELIFRYIFHYLNCRKPFVRLWISSLTDKAIREGLDNLQPGERYDNLYLSAKSRSEADWLIGINATQALSVAAGQGVFSLGRVQTPTLVMICSRYLENKNFVPAKFWQLKAATASGGINFTAQSTAKWEQQPEAIAVLQRVKDAGQLVVKSVERKEACQEPLLLYDLTTLQKEANTKLNFSADKTLSIAQSLYEKKVMSYPRTGSRYIPEDVFDEMPERVALLGQYPRFAGYAAGLDGTPLNRRSVNDGKVTDHHAIIPTVEIARTDLSELPSGERDVLTLLAVRLLCATTQANRFEAVTAILDCQGYTFTAKGKTILQSGWKEVERIHRMSIRQSETEHKENEAVALPVLQEGQTFEAVSASLREGKTSPPKHYTEDTLLSAMETAGAEDMPEDAERKGLGTPATRAATLEKLVSAGFVQRKKKQLIPTEKGKNLIAVLPDNIKSPILTAEWESMLKQVEHGELSATSFMDQIADMSRTLVKEHTTPEERFADLFPSSKGTAHEAVGVCPRCGAPVFEGKKGFFCGNRECSFALWKDNRFFSSKKKSITKSVAAALLKEGRISMSGLYSEKTGRTYDAEVILDDTGGKYVNFKLEFPVKKGRRK